MGISVSIYHRSSRFCPVEALIEALLGCELDHGADAGRDSGLLVPPPTLLGALLRSPS